MNRNHGNVGPFAMPGEDVIRGGVVHLAIHENGVARRHIFQER